MTWAAGLQHCQSKYPGGHLLYITTVEEMARMAELLGNYNICRLWDCMVEEKHKFKQFI
jgi:hypothetical protein